jgi:hypothetical protein
MSGKEESLTQSRLQQFEQELDTLVDSLGLSMTMKPEFEKILDLTYDQLRNISGEEALIFSAQLTQYSIYLQKVFNRLSAIKAWAEHNLMILTSKYALNYGNNYTKLEEKKLYIINENSFAEALNKIYLNSLTKSKEIEQISSKIEKYSYVLTELSKRKNRE